MVVWSVPLRDPKQRLKCKSLWKQYVVKRNQEVGGHDKEGEKFK